MCLHQSKSTPPRTEMVCKSWYNTPVATTRFQNHEIISFKRNNYCYWTYLCAPRVRNNRVHTTWALREQLPCQRQFTLRDWSDIFTIKPRAKSRSQLRCARCAISSELRKTEGEKTFKQKWPMLNCRLPKTWNLLILCTSECVNDQNTGISLVSESPRKQTKPSQAAKKAAYNVYK